MISRIIKYILVSVILIILQTTVARYLSLEGITPDLLTIWVAYIAVQEGQLAGTIAGFVIGLMFDLVVGNFIGLSAMSKTIAGFTGGFFCTENRNPLTLSSYRFLIVVLVVSLVHNALYFVIFTQGSDIGLIRAVLELGMATTFYTTIVALVPMFFFARRYAR